MVAKSKHTQTRKLTPAVQPDTSLRSITEEPPLSARLAFVVQFRRGAGQTESDFAGRAEHMATYKATRFGSEEELVAFLRQVLHTVQAEPEQEL